MHWRTEDVFRSRIRMERRAKSLHLRTRTVGRPLFACIVRCWSTHLKCFYATEAVPYAAVRRGCDTAPLFTSPLLRRRWTFRIVRELFPGPQSCESPPVPVAWPHLGRRQYATRRAKLAGRGPQALREYRRSPCTPPTTCSPPGQKTVSVERRRFRLLRGETLRGGGETSPPPPYVQLRAGWRWLRAIRPVCIAARSTMRTIVGWTSRQ